MSLNVPTHHLTSEAVELDKLPGSGPAPRLVSRAVERLQDKLERMRRANEILKKWRPNQAAPALEQLGFPLATVARLITPTPHGLYGFAEYEIAEVEAEYVKAVRLETVAIIGMQR